LKAVLEECGFDIKGLKAKCSLVCPIKSQKCCLARLLSQQDDFVNQESMLATLIREVGHKCLFLPKFHCELNPIEMVSLCNLFYDHFSWATQYWGWCKSCPTEVIQRFINRSWRFIAAYEQGLTGKAAAWAVKQQKAHQSTSEMAMTTIEHMLVNN